MMDEICIGKVFKNLQIIQNVILDAGLIFDS